MGKPHARHLDGLPPIALFVGTYDLLLADAHACVRRMKAEGYTIEFHEYPGMFYVWVELTWLSKARHAFGGRWKRF